MPTGVEDDAGGNALAAQDGVAIDSIEVQAAIGEAIDVDTGLPLPSLPPTVDHQDQGIAENNDTVVDVDAAILPLSDNNSNNNNINPAPTKPPPSILTRVNKSSFTFKSDVSEKNITNSDTQPHFSGILHATKSTPLPRQKGGGGGGSRSREDHVLVWIHYAPTGEAISVGYLQNRGYRSSSMKFIPYSSKSSWVARYPHAIPHLECSVSGTITGSLPEEHDVDGKLQSKKKMSAAAKKKAEKSANKKSAPKLVSRGNLTDLERDELHIELYNYFSFLKDELTLLETNTSGRRQVSLAYNVPALQGLVLKMEGAFRCVQDVVKERREEHQGKDDSGATVAGMEVDGAAGAASMMQPGPNHTVVTTLLPKATAELPYLENALKSELKQKVIDKMSEQIEEESNKLALSSPRPNNWNRQAGLWRNNDFDTMFQMLLEYKAEKNNVSPPMKHPELGTWVSKIRGNLKKLQKMGLEWEADLDDDASGAKKVVTKPNTYLTQDRVNRLNSIGFAWSTTAPWEQRFDELKQFKEQNGRFPTTKEGTIGGWLKSQRKLYSKNDAKFMAKKAPQFAAIGVSMRERDYPILGWDDRYQQLLEFRRVNGHFNVPNPESEGIHIENQSDFSDAYRFHKFVKRIDTEYRLLQRTGACNGLLNDERIEQLRKIGFVFSIKPEKVIPEVDWNARIQQLEAFGQEMGHMRIDPTYDKSSNLGGWAVEMSQRYKNWQEGREYLAPDEVDKFNHLSAIGFGFDVFRAKRGERSWEDSFNLLLQYRTDTGNCRVPHHYKADARLGSWVAVQRKNYKLWCQDKRSTMTEEKIQRLESLGFEWAPRRGDQS